MSGQKSAEDRNNGDDPMDFDAKIQELETLFRSVRKRHQQTSLQVVEEAEQIARIARNSYVPRVPPVIGEPVSEGDLTARFATYKAV